MTSVNPNTLGPPAPSVGPSTRSSGEISLSQERLLSQNSEHVASDSSQERPGAKVPDAPTRTQGVAGENASRAIDRPLISLTPKLITEDVATELPELNDLKYWPTILELKAVLLLVLLYASTAFAIGILMWKTVQDPDHYLRLSSENVRMISRYFPSIVGTVTVLLFRQTVREALRMEPFTMMTDQKQTLTPGVAPAAGVGGAWFPWQSITLSPKTTLSVVSFVCQFFVSFVVSFKVALLASVQKIDSNNNVAYWNLTVRLWPAIFLLGIYILMISYTVFVFFYFHKTSTGLKWDPVSIADYASLFGQCNALEYFAPLELRHDLRPKHVMVPSRLFRLGYWDRVRDNPREEDVVYGIGVSFPAQTGTENRSLLERKPLGRPWEHKILFRKPRKDQPLPVERCKRPEPCAHGTWPSCEHYPYNQNPGCPRWAIIVASFLSITALSLSIYALSIQLPLRGFTIDNSIKLPGRITIYIGHSNYTLPPIDPVDPDSDVLLWALILRSAPTYVAGIFTATIITWIDINMRFMQPFRNMLGEDDPPKPFGQQVKDFLGIRYRSPSSAQVGQVERKPAKVADSILLAYITVSPMQVPLTAWDKEHYKVCIYSTLNTLSPLFPIFVGGLLTVTPTPDLKHVECDFSLSAYIGVMVSLVLFSTLLPLAMPGAYRLLPRQLYSLADLMALCHQSHFIANPKLNITHKSRTPSKQHMEARILLDDKHFLFGVYRGRDGKSHIGFDVTRERRGDFGTFQDVPYGVRHVRPDGLTDWLRRTATSMVEQGRAFTGSIVANPRNPFLQSRHGISADSEHNELETFAEASGSRRRDDVDRVIGRTRTIPRKPVPSSSYNRITPEAGNYEG